MKGTLEITTPLDVDTSDRSIGSVSRIAIFCTLLALTPGAFAETTASDCDNEWLNASAASYCDLGPADTTVDNPEDGDQAICNLEITCPKPGVADLPQKTVQKSLALDCVNTLYIVNDKMDLGTNCP
ncbi:MAG: hypothetical protein OXG51_10540 [Gammaproteobacteria bacterium]|nr:hypothetical protein [Gammaproteobacteria bacterium]